MVKFYKRDENFATGNHSKPLIIASLRRHHRGNFNNKFNLVEFFVIIKISHIRGERRAYHQNSENN